MRKSHDLVQMVSADESSWNLQWLRTEQGIRTCSDFSGLHETPGPPWEIKDSDELWPSAKVSLGSLTRTRVCLEFSVCLGRHWTLTGANIPSALARAAAVLSMRGSTAPLAQKCVPKTVLWLVCLQFLVLILLPTRVWGLLQCQQFC